MIKLCKAMIDIKFVFAGKGNFKSEIDKLPNAEIVGFLQGEELKKVISNALVVINPSECYETYGLSNAEAIINGVPVIASNIGAFPEVVIDGETGRLFEVGNVKEIQEIMSNFLTNSEILDRYSQNCKSAKFMSVEKYVHILNGFI